MIAVIAGTGTLPVEACKNLLKLKDPFFVISLFPEDNFLALQQVIQNNSEIVCQKFYKVEQILNLIKGRNTKKILFIGKVDKSHLLKNFKFDWLAVKMLASIIYKSDSALMDHLVRKLEMDGFSILKQNEVLGSLIVKPGVLTGKITPSLKTDIEMGIDAAIKISHLDIGQTVVVKNQMILAIEAIEGTNNCIKRGIKLGKNNVIICKAAHKNQNHKFDLPTLGPDSLKNLSKGDVAAIAWLSNKTLIAQQDEFIKKAQSLGITLVSY